MYQRLFKPFLDFFISIISLILLSPLLLIISLLIYYKLGSPILFKQKRPGKMEKIFTLYKFRTMTDKRDSTSELLPDNERITIFGSFLRKSSLDELPQLFNVLRGELSFVGPRPLLIEYLPLYNNQQSLRHSVKPGITGWAQVNGRNAISWEEKFKLDLYYVNNQSFILDLKILLKTVINVFKGSDIYTEKGLTMDKFNGGN